jgi:hypothetical protein
MLPSEAKISLAPALIEDEYGPAPLLSQYNWWEIVGGIVLSGGVYPLAAFAVTAVIQAAAAIGGIAVDVSPAMALAGIVSIVTTFAVIGLTLSAAGMVWFSMISFLTAPFVYGFVRTLQLRGDAARFGAVWGGLVAFLAVLPFLMGITATLRRMNDFGWEYLVVLAGGPCLSIVVGQLGGAWGGRRAKRTKTLQHAVQIPSIDLKAPRDQPRLDADSSATPPFQYSIRHLLWVTVWLSLLLTAIRLCGIPMELVAPLFVGWLAYQSLTLYSGERLLKGWRQRRAAVASQTAST